MPVLLESESFAPLALTRAELARQVGYWSPDLSIPCIESGSHGSTCKLPVFGHWIDTSSFRCALGVQHT